MSSLSPEIVHELSVPLETRPPTILGGPSQSPCSSAGVGGIAVGRTDGDGERDGDGDCATSAGACSGATDTTPMTSPAMTAAVASLKAENMLVNLLGAHANRLCGTCSMRRRTSRKRSSGISVGPGASQASSTGSMSRFGLMP